MTTHHKVGVVGAGSWGTALANVFADAENQVAIWGRDGSILDSIKTSNENVKYLKGLKLNPSIQPMKDLEAMLQWCDSVVCAIPTQQIRSVFGSHTRHLSGKILVNASKGIEQGTQSRVSEIFADMGASVRYVILSGPSFAEETVKRLPTLVTVAGVIPSDGKAVQELVSTAYFRAYTTQDVVGVELAGALKNVVAIASGVVSGLNLGHNAQAALINRGLAEIARLGHHLGATTLTFLGLAGMGDLILTCTGPLSRNRRFGTMVGQGKKIEEIASALNGVAEGYYTAKSALSLGRAVKVELPITESVYGLLYEGLTPKEALQRLMARDLRDVAIIIGFRGAGGKSALTACFRITRVSA